MFCLFIKQMIVHIKHALAKEAFCRLLSSFDSFLMSAANCNPAVAPDKVFVAFPAVFCRSSSRCVVFCDLSALGGDKSESESFCGRFMATEGLLFGRRLTGERSPSESCLQASCFICRRSSECELWWWTDCREEWLEFLSWRKGDVLESASLNLFVLGGDRSESESCRLLTTAAFFNADWSLVLGGERSESESCRCRDRLPARFGDWSELGSTLWPAEPLARTGERSESELESWRRSLPLTARTPELVLCRWSDLIGGRSESEWSRPCSDLHRGTSWSESESWCWLCRVTAAVWWSLADLWMLSLL